ncbi:MFS general substrate transporter [Panaeolus papilionaceus]|nr:MFS general substrate transporter [Panaeolus papilionaceus]
MDNNPSLVTLSDNINRNIRRPFVNEANLKEKFSASTLVTQDGPDTTTDSVLPSMTNNKGIDFPEGGLRAWLTILGAFLVQYSSFGYINAFGAYQDFYVREYLTRYTPSDIGWIGGVQIFLTFSCGAFTGRIFDKGYFYHLMSVSVLLHAIALFMLSLSHPNQYYQVFLTNGISLGLATGISYVPSLGIAAHYFQRRRPIAVGIISSGSALGAVLHPIMLNRFFSNPNIGFHNGVRISAGLNLTLLLIALALMRTRLPPKTTSVSASQIKRWLNPKKDPAYFVFLVSAVPCFLGLFFSVFYIQLDAVLHGVSEDFAFYSLSILNAASLLGRIIPALLAPRLGVFNLGVFCTTATGFVVLCMLAIRNIVGTALFAIFFGFTSGAAIALTPAMLALLAKDPNEIGQRMGIYFGWGGIFGLFATPISGALLTQEYLWTSPTVFAGIMVITAGCLFAVTRYFVSKSRESHWV